MLRRLHSGMCLKALKGIGCRLEAKRGMVEGRKALVLGAWEGSDGEKYKLTEGAEYFNSAVGGALNDRFPDCMKTGQVELTHALDEFYAVALVCAGKEGLGFVDSERRDQTKESIRKMVAKGVNILAKQECCTVCVDAMSSADAAAEGAKMANWVYQELKTPPKLATPEINLYPNNPSKDVEEWDTGCIMADAQNTARYLTEVPSNVMTPKHFAEEIIRILCPCGVHVTVRPLPWIEEQRMFCFLNMAKGSCQMPYFVEVNYCGGGETDRPVVLIGKGLTYDSGGLSLRRCMKKTHKHEDLMEARTANTGAAAVVGAIKALARMRAPVNVVGLMPLFENMPSGGAVKPGDVVMARNGKTVVVEDTDNEGRMAVADALTYSEQYRPCLDVAVGDFTFGSRQALGSGATPTFSSSTMVWNELEKASGMTGDRVWRFPLWNRYCDRVTACRHVDVCNSGIGTPDANSCLCAAFLQKFVPGCDYVQLDTTGTGLITHGHSAPYLRRGFATGRPTRTIAQFVYNMACPLDNAGQS